MDVSAKTWTPGVFPCVCSEFAPVSEAAALAAGRYLGQGDTAAAAGAAAAAMRSAFADLPVTAHVVIGKGEPGDRVGLPPGETVGAGGPLCSLAVDPLEGTDIVARGLGGAMSVVVVGAPEHILSLPDMYMQKLVVGPRAAGRIDIEAPVADNLRAVADAYDRAPTDLTVIVLDRPRHESLVAEVRRVGARIKLIADGDITASIAAAVEGTGDQVYIGIGGAAEGVITAAAMRCLGGEIQAKLWPLSRKEVERARAHGIDDIEMVLGTDDLVKGDIIFSATGVTSGDFLRGIDYFRDGARSHTLVMCTRCRTVRFVDTIHLFSDERREIRL